MPLARYSRSITPALQEVSGPPRCVTVSTAGWSSPAARSRWKPSTGSSVAGGVSRSIDSSRTVIETGRSRGGLANALGRPRAAESAGCIDTGLISVLRVEPGSTPDPEGAVPRSSTCWRGEHLCINRLTVFAHVGIRNRCGRPGWTGRLPDEEDAPLRGEPVPYRPCNPRQPNRNPEP